LAIVGTLTVDLVANTASFEGKMGDASKTARKSSRDIQDSFNSINFSEARGGVMVLGEELGIHLPRHVQAFVATLPGVGAAMDAAFPVLAVVAIVVALGEAATKLAHLGDEAKKVANDQIAMGTAISTSFNSLDEKLLQAGIQADELSKNHLDALKKRLELINMQSMSELSHAFDVISKAADKVFSDLTSHWYSFGIGSDGAKNALITFKTQYDSLLAQGKDVAAADLLTGTLASARHILDLQREGLALIKDPASQKLGGLELQNRFKAQSLELAKAGVGLSENEVKSQEALVNTLQAQIVAQSKVTDLKGKETTAANQKDVSEYNEAQVKKLIILQDAIKSSSTLIEGQSDRNIKGIEKENAVTIKAIDEQLALYERIDATQMKINTLTREISDQEALQAQKLAVATGHLTEQQAVQKALTTLEENKKHELDEINGRLEAQLAIVRQLDAATSGGSDGTGDQKVQYAKSVAAYKDMEAQKLQITKQFNAQIDAERLKQANNERSQWNKMFLDFSQVQTHMSQFARQTLNQMNSSIAQFVVTGQGNFRQLAASAIESFIEIFLQEEEAEAAAVIKRAIHSLEKKVTNAADAQSSAAAGAAATLADVPYPANIPASAQVLAVGEAYAADALAMRGAVLPNREMLVNTHPEEMILPQHISNFVVDAASRASGSEQRGGDTNHFVFAPVLHNVDSTGVDSLLKHHGDRFVKHVVDRIRRQNYN
jgi:hypothetical protein